MPWRQEHTTESGNKKKICSSSIKFLKCSPNWLLFSNHITGKIRMCVVSCTVRLPFLTVSTLSSETCAIFKFAFWQSKIFLEGYLFVEFVSELQIRPWGREMEVFPLEFFPLYFSSTRCISAIYCILHLILLYHLVLLHSQRLTTLNKSKRLSHHKSYSI